MNSDASCPYFAERLAGTLLGAAVGDALGLPREGLSRRRAAWAVLRVQGDRARVTPVDLGRRNARSAEAIAGLRATRLVAPPLPDTSQISCGGLVIPSFFILDLSVPEFIPSMDAAPRLPSITQLVSSSVFNI